MTPTDLTGLLRLAYAKVDRSGLAGIMIDHLNLKEDGRDLGRARHHQLADRLVRTGLVTVRPGDVLVSVAAIAKEQEFQREARARGLVGTKPIPVLGRVVDGGRIEWESSR